MSDLIYNETNLNGTPYKVGRWKEYAVHDDTRICGFFGEYRYLSNFHESYVFFHKIQFKSVEHAYQAAKSLDPKEWERFSKLETAREAKKEGRKVQIRPDWEQVKLDLMFQFVFQKFNLSDFLCNQLTETGNKYLEETNHWNDTFWGVDIKNGGKNYLGKILMKVRQIL
jgi:ribA/ribD-fused uncharacterized protein